MKYKEITYIYIYIYTLSPLPPAKPPKIIMLQRKCYTSKTYFGVFKVFTCLNLASSPIIFKQTKVNLTPANSLLMQRESSKKNRSRKNLQKVAKRSGGRVGGRGSGGEGEGKGYACLLCNIDVKGGLKGWTVLRIGGSDRRLKGKGNR